MDNFGIIQNGNARFDNSGTIAFGVGTPGRAAGTGSGPAGAASPGSRERAERAERARGHHTVVSTDVVGSGSRDDQLQLRMRADLRAIVDEVLDRQQLSPDTIHRDDLGDGIRLIVGPETPPEYLLDPFVPNLASALRLHARAASDLARLRLRVAVHMGLMRHDGQGWTGHPLVHTARLLDARPVREALRAAPSADLVVVVSQLVYETVVLQGYALALARFREIRIAEKETTSTAWIHVPGEI